MLPLTSATLKQNAPTKPYSLRKLALGSSMRVLHQLLGIGIGFALTPFIIHWLGPEQYGIWALAGAFVGYYSLLDLGLSGAVFTHMSHAIGAQDYENGARIYRTGLSIFSLLGGILVVVTLCIAAGVLLLHPSHSITLSIVVLVVGFQTAVSFPMRAPFGVLNAGSHFETTSLVLIMSAVLRTIGTVVVLRAGKGVLGLAVINLLAWIPGYTLVCIAVHWRYPFIRPRALGKWDRPTAHKLFSFGVPVLIGQIADRIRLQTDTLVVSLFLGLSAVTHYNIATTLDLYYMDGILAIIGVLTPVLSMQMSARDTAGMRSSILTGTRLAICTGGFAAFGLIVLGKDFIRRWMGSAYVDAYPVLVVLVAAMFLDLWQSTTVNALFATMHQKTYAKVNISEAIANLFLSLALAPRFGMLGIALGTLIPSVMVRGFVQPWIVERKLGIPAISYYGLSARAMLRTIACLILPCVIALRFLKPSYPALFLTGALSFVAFALPIWYLEFNMIGSARIRSRLAGLFKRAPGEA
ncbi:MAG TPA: oligosaccharide flippase family protein [Silvibacterium sp.]|nr:oligosaccharide flippase family protein [Silvibacterium sp.]